MRFPMFLSVALLGMLAVGVASDLNQRASNQRNEPVVVAQDPGIPPPECGLYDICKGTRIEPVIVAQEPGFPPPECGLYDICRGTRIEPVVVAQEPGFPPPECGLYDICNVASVL